MTPKPREDQDPDHAYDMRKDRELREADWRKQGLCDMCGLKPNTEHECGEP